MFELLLKCLLFYFLLLVVKVILGGKSLAYSNNSRDLYKILYCNGNQWKTIIKGTMKDPVLRTINLMNFNCTITLLAGVNDERSFKGIKSSNKKKFFFLQIL